MKKYIFKFLYFISSVAFIGVNFIFFSSALQNTKINNTKSIHNNINNVLFDQFSYDPNKIELALGTFNTGVILDGKIYVWGRNNSGHLGIGSSYRYTDTPTLLKLMDMLLS